jgi:lysyl-tRNA synthetase class 2
MEFDTLTQQRLAKLERLRAAGVDPYPPRCQRTNTLAQALALFATQEAGGDAPTLQLAGRIVSWRGMGKATFAHLADGTGRLQVYLRRDVLGEEKYAFLENLDIGDFLGVSGYLFRTRTGEVTLEVQDYTLLAKSLHPLPEKWHGLKDVETRYRQRYLDLLANADVRQTFVVRSQVVAAMRRFLDGRGFLEVETPILQPLYGGAAARPFVTHHHALDRDLYLRIATELYLKRLIVGGYDKVYEIGKDFRNEGVDALHNPEFTMMESYEAYADYHDVMRMVEELVAYIAQEVLGTTRVVYEGQEIELAPPWRRRPMRQAILEETGVDIGMARDLPALRQAVGQRGLELDFKPTWAKSVDELFGTYVQPRLIQPTFIMDYPVELSPLAKKKADDPTWVERFEGFAGGLELSNAFTELNDPLDQLARFQQQAAERAAGDEEAQPSDEDFVTALLYGLPPTGGLGMGIDRLVMLLTDNSSIRDVILFPQMRTKEFD